MLTLWNLTNPSIQPHPFSSSPFRASYRQGNNINFVYFPIIFDPSSFRYHWAQATVSQHSGSLLSLCTICQHTSQKSLKLVSGRKAARYFRERELDDEGGEEREEGREEEGPRIARPLVTNWSVMMRSRKMKMVMMTVMVLVMVMVEREGLRISRPLVTNCWEVVMILKWMSVKMVSIHFIDCKPWCLQGVSIFSVLPPPGLHSTTSPLPLQVDLPFSPPRFSSSFSSIFTIIIVIKALFINDTKGAKDDQLWW